MKKAIVLLLTLLAINSFSQKKDKSGSFEIPEGSSSLLQFKNGNTIFIEITKKEGINVVLFDTLRKKIASGKLSTKIIGDKIGYYLHEGVFAIGGNVVMFLQIAEGRTPVLIRIVVDGKTGKLISEEKISELDKMKGGAGYAVVFGGVDIPDFEIVKDPESDYYALIRYNSMAEQTKDRIEVIHYGPDHKVINKANYTTPNSEFKYTKYLSAYVHKDDYVAIATYAFNTDKTGGDAARFYVSLLPKGKSSFKQLELPYKDFYKSAECLIVYNSFNQMLNLSLITNSDVKRNTRLFEYHFQNINPSTLKADAPYSPDFSRVNDYYREKMERDRDFGGLLHWVGIDQSGNTILYFQETTISTSSQGTVKSYYGDVAMLTISPAGKTTNSAVFGASTLGRSGFAAMLVLNTQHNNYLLFNNSVDNMSLPETKEPKMVKAAGLAVPVKYTYTNNSVKKEYLFKEPKEKKGNPYCDFGISSYSPITKKLATLYFEPEKKKACILWINLD